MAFESNPDDRSSGLPPAPQFNGPTGPYAPLPPSRRQRDTSVQWVAFVVVLVVSIVVVVVLMSIRPSKNVTPAPRAPSTHSQQDCAYQYLSCPTTRRTR